MDIHRQFGKRLRVLRVRAGLTQRELADAVSLTSTSISNIERGVYAVSLHRLPELADALGVCTYELFLFDNPRP